MARTILIAGFGPGISEAVARKFGGEGFRVALVARHGERVVTAAKALEEAGITAKGFACDVGDPAAVKALIAEVKGSLGPVTVIHWNAYAGAAGDLLAATPDEIRKPFDVGVTGLVVALGESQADMKEQEGAAVLVTGGGFAFYDEKIDSMIVAYKSMGLSLAKAAQHKLVGILHQRLRDDGIYVGEVVVLGMVKGTAFDAGHATLEPATVGEAFWKIYQERSAVSVNVS